MQNEIRKILNYYESDLNEISDYIKEDKKYMIFDTKEQVNYYFEESVNDFMDNNTFSDIGHLLKYTGYDYLAINSILRGVWDYELLGVKSPEKEKSLRETINVMDRVIQNFPPLDFNFEVSRGVNISYFKDYDVRNINDLTKLSNSFLFEPGFCSTSIIKDNDFFQKKDYRNINYNVRIIYEVDGSYSDGVLLNNDYLSYSQNQMEYLINDESLSFVKKVDVDEKNNTAIVYAILIPSKVWNKKKHNKMIKN